MSWKISFVLLKYSWVLLVYTAVNLLRLQYISIEKYSSYEKHKRITIAELLLH